MLKLCIYSIQTSLWKQVNGINAMSNLNRSIAQDCITLFACPAQPLLVFLRRACRRCCFGNKGACCTATSQCENYFAAVISKLCGFKCGAIVLPLVETLVTLQRQTIWALLLGRKPKLSITQNHHSCFSFLRLFLNFKRKTTSLQIVSDASTAIVSPGSRLLTTDFWSPSVALQPKIKS